MLKHLQNDEHQFVASGALLARHASLPYRDYPYFHMPNLVFIYAALFKMTDYLLLASRMVSVVSAALAVGTICWTALQLFLDGPRWRRFLIAAGAVLLLMCNPLFTFTSGRAWNHDLPTLLILLAFLACCLGTRRPHSVGWVAASGLLLGFAIGTRLTYLPLLAPFAAVAMWHPSTNSWRKRIVLTSAFGGGVLIGLAPALVLFAIAPEQFIFGNFEWARLNTQFRADRGHAETMTLLSKLKYVWQAMGRTGNLVIVLTLLVVTPWASMVPRSWSPAKLEKERQFPLVFVLALMPFFVVGAFAPTPTWYQYLYAPIPFLVLAILYGLAAHRNEAAGRMALKVFVVIVVVAVAYGSKDYRQTPKLIAFEQWTPVKVHRMGQQFTIASGSRKVLTLAPIVPLEGGREIYKELVTGPFAWRTARFLPQRRRQALGMISEQELSDLVRRDPPGQVLVGFEKHGVEEGLIAYAQRDGYTPTALTDQVVLWAALP
jgi:4-amino-4-deoxy-L-arabinose transferase-like glycosyltransferase